MDHQVRLAVRPNGLPLSTDFEVSNSEGLTALVANPKKPSYVLDIMGMPGFTAYIGLLDIGMLQGNNFGKVVIQIGEA